MRYYNLIRASDLDPLPWSDDNICYDRAGLQRRHCGVVRIGPAGFAGYVINSAEEVISGC